MRLRNVENNDLELEMDEFHKTSGESSRGKMLGHFGQYHLSNRNPFYTRREGTDAHSTSSCVCLAWLPSWWPWQIPREEPRSRRSGKTRCLRETAGKKRSSFSSAREKERNGTSTETGDFVGNASRIIFPFVHARRNKYLLPEPWRGRTRACTLLKLRYERKRRDKYELHATDVQQRCIMLTWKSGRGWETWRGLEKRAGKSRSRPSNTVKVRGTCNTRVCTCDERVPVTCVHARARKSLIVPFYEKSF